LIPCLQSQIGLVRYLRRQGTAQVEPAVALSVIVRRGPARTAVNGTLVARQAGIGGMGGAIRSCLDRRARPVLGSHRLVGKPRSGAAVSCGLVRPRMLRRSGLLTESGWLAAPAPVQHCAQAACASIWPLSDADPCCWPGHQSSQGSLTPAGSGVPGRRNGGRHLPSVIGRL
jgi:hypothetical protein